MDLSKLNSDPAAACAQVRLRTIPGDPENSQIVVSTHPGSNSTHKFRFNGNNSAYANFVAGVTPWIQLEAQ